MKKTLRYVGIWLALILAVNGYSFLMVGLKLTLSGWTEVAWWTTLAVFVMGVGYVLHHCISALCDIDAYIDALD